MEKNEVITLEDRGFIQVNGPEAKDFLQRHKIEVNPYIINHSLNYKFIN